MTESSAPTLSMSALTDLVADLIADWRNDIRIALAQYARALITGLCQPVTSSSQWAIVPASLGLLSDEADPTFVGVHHLADEDWETAIEGMHSMADGVYCNEDTDQDIGQEDALHQRVTVDNHLLDKHNLTLAQLANVFGHDVRRTAVAAHRALHEDTCLNGTCRAAIFQTAPQVVMDATGQVVVLLPDLKASWLREQVLQGWQDITDTYGESRLSRDSWVALHTEDILHTVAASDAVPARVRAEAARDDAEFHGRIIGESAWDPETRSIRDDADLSDVCVPHVPCIRPDGVIYRPDLTTTWDRAPGDPLPPDRDLDEYLVQLLADGTSIGHAIVIDCGLYLWIEDIEATPQRHGHGSRLLTAVLEAFPGRMFALSADEQLVPWYEAFGFTPGHVGYRDCLVRVVEQAEVRVKSV